MRILYGHLKVNTFAMASAGTIRFGACAGNAISGLSDEDNNDPNLTAASPAIAPKSAMPAWGFHLKVLLWGLTNIYYH
jgi:hypothetical protein